MLPIIYQDEYMVAVNKPPGLLVHRTKIDRFETEFAVQMLRDQIGRKVYPIHRLDKPTSGVLLFGLDVDCARGLNEGFASRETEKTYLAVVRGYTEESGHIDHALQEKHDKMTDSQAQTDKAAQEAISDYRRLATVELPIPVGRYDTSRYSLVELYPKTGRKHQLRRHMKHIFHHIVGDTSHGDGRHNRMFQEHFNLERLLLACVEMKINHPASGERLNLVAPISDDFAQLVDSLGWSDVEEVRRWRTG